MTLSSDVAPSRRAQIVAAVVVAVSLALFALIAEDLLEGGGLVAHDEAVLDWFVDHRTQAWISAARLISTVGTFVSLAILGALLGIWLWRHGAKPLFAAAPLVAVVLASLASTVAKAHFDRERPPVIAHAESVTVPAFPSGHATDAAAFFLASALTLALTRTNRRSVQLLLIAVGIICAALVGLSRLVLGVHWLSDVVAGWALGTAFAVAVVVGTWYLTTRQPA